MDIDWEKVRELTEKAKAKARIPNDDQLSAAFRYLMDSQLLSSPAIGLAPISTWGTMAFPYTVSFDETAAFTDDQ